MKLARFEVRLPSGWEYRGYWANHAAVPPQSAGSSQSIFTMTEIDHTQLGRLLFFDPTDPYVAFGNLPSILHSSYGLVVTPSGGELAPAATGAGTRESCRARGQARLHADGSLQGTVTG